MAATRKVRCAGDSNTFGFGVSAGSAYPDVMAASLGADYDVVNTGVSGRTTQDIVAAAPAEIDAYYDPLAVNNICTVLGGTNNMLNPTAIDSSDAALETIAALNGYGNARRVPGYVTIACTVPHVNALFTAALTQTQVNNRLAAIRTALLASHAFQGIADLYGDSRLQNFSDTTYYQSDGVHLTAAGHAVVAGLVTAAVQALPDFKRLRVCGPSVGSGTLASVWSR